MKTAPIVATVLTISAIILMLKLGFWQLDRMQQKQQRLEQLAMRESQQAINLREISNITGNINDVQVSFSGQVVNDKVFLLDNRIVNGKVGYELLVPVITNVGTVLVNYGWIAAPMSRQQLPKIELSSAVQEFTGRIVQPNINPVVRETAEASSGFPMRVQQIDIPALSELAALNLRPYIVVLPEGFNPQFIGNWQPVVMAPEKHFGYALQWFGLAIAAAIIFIVIVIRRKVPDEKQ